MEDNQDVAVPVAAMNALVLRIKMSKSFTWMELEQELRSSITILKNCDPEYLRGCTSLSLTSGCELFMKYVTRSFNIDSFSMKFSECKNELLRRGERFAGMSLASRARIAEIGHSFVQDNCTVLIHGNSRVVTALIIKASKSKQFKIIITEGRPSIDGRSAAEQYAKAGIPTTLVLDCAVGSIMDKVDLCLVGAEGVMENGGIVNKLGTYQIAMVAKALKKPFYVAVESYKFARMYPFNQKDLYKDNNASIDINQSFDYKIDDVTMYQHPSIDFTPSEFISLLFTDLGVLTPAAVSDELIKLYQ
eukprot:gene19252-25104_t